MHEKTRYVGFEVQKGYNNLVNKNELYLYGIKKDGKKVFLCVNPGTKEGRKWMEGSVEQHKITCYCIHLPIDISKLICNNWEMTGVTTGRDALIVFNQYCIEPWKTLVKQLVEGNYKPV